jgi:hypothetical protein
MVLAHSLTMKTSQNPTARLCLSLASLLLLTPLTGAQTSAISVDRVNYFSQTGASTVAPQAEPFTLNFHIRGGTTNMANWGPAFYKPGSAGVPQSGTSSATNTGTLNFSAAPNNGASFMFTHDFASNAALEAFYPVAPTDGGAYGIKFLGSAPPTPALFDDGLVFAAGTTYPSVTPQITSVNNGATWSGSTLRIKPHGVTTLTFNAFPEYNSTTYGSFIAVGIYSNTNGVVDEASAESYYLPLGDSSVPPVVPVNQPALTQLSIDGSWLTPGVSYTMELQYAILAGQPEEANLNGIEFQGLATYRRLTTITIMVPALGADFNTDGKTDLIWQNLSSGQRTLWLMDGVTASSGATLGTVATNLSIAGSGHFNGDGVSDLIWQNTSTGEWIIWLMNGTTKSSEVSLGAIPPPWFLAGTGDFNEDGKSDLIWQNTSTGQRVIWFMNGTAPNGGTSLGVVPPEWEIAGSGDFNSDGKSDLIWQNNNTGQRTIWLMNGTSPNGGVSLGVVPAEWKIVNSGDFNDDGKSDLIWQNPTTGQRVVWMMNGTTVASGANLPAVPLPWMIAN